MDYLNDTEIRNRNLYEILSLNQDRADDWEIIKRQYRALNIDKVKIDGNTFTNYGEYQFIWEKTYVTEPKRSGSGSIGNLDSYATFITPHLIINFSIMTIDDYRRIMQMHYSKNEFIVECYDPIYNTKVKVKMYFGTEQMAKLHTIARKRFNGAEWEDWIELVGVREYSVEMVGTNNDLDLVSVVYHLNPPVDTGRVDETFGEYDVYNGEDVVIGSSASSITTETFGGIYKFKNWNLSPNPIDIEKEVYINGNVYTINQGDEKNALVLYAQWQSTTEHTLTYNYGLADPEINDSTNVYITNKLVSKGSSIGNLPVAETPKVKYKDLNGKEHTVEPYENGQWWKIPQKIKKFDENGNDITSTLIVTNNEPYWSNRDSTIYLLYDTKEYNLNLYLEGKLYQKNSIEYNTPMNLPQLVKSGYTFDGWYRTSDFKEGTKISGKMPPQNITLYARWVEIK